MCHSHLCQVVCPYVEPIPSLIPYVIVVNPDTAFGPAAGCFKILAPPS